MIINSIIGSKRSSGANLVTLSTTMPYTDFIRFEGETLELQFNYSHSDFMIGSGAFFVNGQLIKSEVLSTFNEWDVSNFLLVNTGPSLIRFRVSAVDYETNSAKIDFRVIYDYKDFPNMVFGLAPNGNFKILGYTASSIENKQIEFFRYSYIDGYGIKIVTEVGDEAFWGRTDIDKIVLPDTITRIGNSSFTNCSALSVIELHSVIPPILNSVDAFNGTEPGFKIKVPAESLSLYQTEWAGKVGNAIIEAL
jgi:hypothetical protein